MARVVAESSPPESKTTARGLDICSIIALIRQPRNASFEHFRLPSWHVAPQVLVQLDLEAHRQAIREDPVGEITRGELLVARRKEHGAALRQCHLAELCAAPLVIATVADDELHQVMRREARQLLVAIASFLARAGSLDVHDLHHPRIDVCQCHRAAGLERYPQARIAQRRKQRRAPLLGERLAAGDAYVARGVFLHPRYYRRQLPPLPAVKRISGVAVLTAQWTAGEAHKHGGDAGGVRLPLK